jgi:hypothetical protein
MQENPFTGSPHATPIKKGPQGFGADDADEDNTPKNGDDEGGQEEGSGFNYGNRVFFEVEVSVLRPGSGGGADSISTVDWKLYRTYSQLKALYQELVQGDDPHLKYVRFPLSTRGMLGRSMDAAGAPKKAGMSGFVGGVPSVHGGDDAAEIASGSLATSRSFSYHESRRHELACFLNEVCWQRQLTYISDTALTNWLEVTAHLATVMVVSVDRGVSPVEQQEDEEAADKEAVDKEAADKEDADKEPAEETNEGKTGQQKRRGSRQGMTAPPPAQGSIARELRWRNWRVLGSVRPHNWWGQLYPRGEQYILRWERSILRKLGTAMQNLSTETMLWAAKQTLQSTVLSAIFNPITIPGYIDNVAKQQVDGEWAMACDRANKAGVLLAHTLMRRSYGHGRPITLMGYSTGARLIFSCLLELARIDSAIHRAAQQDASDEDGTDSKDDKGGKNASNIGLPPAWRCGARGIIGDVLLLGAPVACESTGQTPKKACRKTVAGQQRWGEAAGGTEEEYIEQYDDDDDEPDSTGGAIARLFGAKEAAEENAAKEAKRDARDSSDEDEDGSAKDSGNGDEYYEEDWRTAMGKYTKAHWRQIKRVVGGRLINGYTTNDMILSVLYRSYTFGTVLHVAGLQPINVDGVVSEWQSFPVPCLTVWFVHLYLIGGYRPHPLGWWPLGVPICPRARAPRGRAGGLRRWTAALIRLCVSVERPGGRVRPPPGLSGVVVICVWGGYVLGRTGGPVLPWLVLWGRG